MDTSKVNRLEIIDHRPCEGCNGLGYILNNKDNGKGIICGKCQGMQAAGRTVIVGGPAYGHADNAEIQAMLQDDDRTLKIFISAKKA